MPHLLDEKYHIITITPEKLHLNMHTHVYLIKCLRVALSLIAQGTGHFRLRTLGFPSAGATSNSKRAIGAVCNPIY